MALKRFCECVDRGEIDRAGQSGNRGPTPKPWRELDATRARDLDGHSRRLDSSQLQALPSLKNPGHQGISRRIV